MNILREVRRFNNKSMPLRIISILVFAVISIVTTYAWFSSQKDVKTQGLRGYTTSWDVEYYINNDTTPIVDHTATFTIPAIYPGMDPNANTNIVHIYNVGEASSNIKYELMSVKLFGEELLTTNAQGKQVLNVHKKNADGEDVIEQVEIGVDGNTTTIFAGDTSYPFKVSYTYDKDYLNGQYDPTNEETSVSAHATMSLNVSWDYEETDDTTTESTNESEEKDILDTKFGKDAYAYYQTEGSDPSKAIEIKVKITSSMIHPSLES